MRVGCPEASRTGTLMYSPLILPPLRPGCAAAMAIRVLGMSSDTEPVTRDGVARAWRSALQQVQEWEFSTVTVPPIGTGAGNLTVEDAAEIMVPILKIHLGSATFPAEVSFVVETPAERDAFEAVLRRGEAAES